MIRLSLKTRYDIPKLCALLGHRTAVEIGVGRGRFSRYILQTMPDATLYSIDPWRTLAGEFIESYFNWTVTILSPYVSRNVIIVAASPSIANAFADESLDFVYIDGDHRYSAVSADLRAWWPKVKPGGILAGDDYSESLHLLPLVSRREWKLLSRKWKKVVAREYIRNVRDAVHDFVRENDLELNVTTVEYNKYGGSLNFWLLKDA